MENNLTPDSAGLPDLFLHIVGKGKNKLFFLKAETSQSQQLSEFLALMNYLLILLLAIYIFNNLYL